MKRTFLITFLTAFTLLTVSFVTAGCKKVKLKGTSWVNYVEMIALDDAPSIKTTKILKFLDNKNVELQEVTEYSGHSSSYVNEDGTVKYTPASSKESTKTGTYVLKGDAVEVTFDGETEKYYLNDKLLLQGTTVKEYNQMSDFDRDYVTFKLME